MATDSSGLSTEQGALSPNTGRDTWGRGSEEAGRFSFTWQPFQQELGYHGFMLLLSSQLEEQKV